MYLFVWISLFAEKHINLATIYQNRTILSMNRRRSLTIWSCIFIAGCLVLWFKDRFLFPYLEQQQTFFADAGFLRYIFSQVGGLSILIADLAVQFFTAPLAGVMITAALLTLMAFATWRIIRKITGNSSHVLLSLIPSVGCALQLYDMNFHYFGLVAMLLSVLCLWGYASIDNLKYRLACGGVIVPVLFAAAGAVASLFAISAFVIELFRTPRGFWKFLLLPGLAAIAAAVALRAGAASGWHQLAGPYAYYTLRLDIPGIAWISWACWGAALIVACALAAIHIEGKTAAAVLTGTEALALVALICLGGMTCINRSDLFFRELNQHARNGEWDEIISRYKGHKGDNLLYHNYLCIALAERGLLGEKAFEFPLQSIRSIYVETNKTPYVSNLLGDVFFSMGEIGLAQRYYFECNEAWGNYSPRMLKNLAVTNMSYGAYDVADKYLSLLKKTLKYRRWALQHEEILGDEEAIAADPLIGAKRKCIFPDNKLSGFGGLDIDLKNIIRSNPKHNTTIQYLCTLFLLLRDLDSFVGTVEEFLNTEAFGNGMPLNFQQALCIYCDDDSSKLSGYGVSAEVADAFKAFKEKPSSHKDSYWFYYYYRNMQ